MVWCASMRRFDPQKPALPFHHLQILHRSADDTMNDRLTKMTLVALSTWANIPCKVSFHIQASAS
jgi:UV DNA damage repair endonuclease